MAVLVLLFGFVLAGCSTTKYAKVETETSKAIYEAASELVRSQANGIRAGALVSGLASKFPGLKKRPLLAIQFGLISVRYQDTDYEIDCTMDTGSGSSTAGDNTMVMSIKSVYTNVAVEPDQDGK